MGKYLTGTELERQTVDTGEQISLNCQLKLQL
jgi:hypothetical protein